MAEKAKGKAVKESKRPVGKTTKVGIQETWVMAFEHGSKKNWTDAQISDFMKKEFPGRKSDIFDRVSHVRSKYNAGGLTGGRKPKRVERYEPAKPEKKGKAKAAKKEPEAVGA